MDSMKVENLLMGAFLFGGTTLLARVLSQGFEQALLATAMEWTIDRARAMRRSLR